jgi:acetyltransferase-like isoleucine patch superfamily enzyme
VEGILPHPEKNPILIGHDVWIGIRVIILPGCKFISNTAIIGAGAVVTCDVPPFTVVPGFPARPVRKRFGPEVETVVAASEWWWELVDRIVQHPDLFTGPQVGRA